MQMPLVPPESIRICVAEDNLVNQKIMGKFLGKRRFCNVHFYGNGQDAVQGIHNQAAKGQPYHIIFMDSHMPVMDGMRATALIRGHPHPAVHRVPIIGLVIPEKPVTREFMQSVQDCVKKPIQRLRLYDMVEMYAVRPLSLSARLHGSRL